MKSRTKSSLATLLLSAALTLTSFTSPAETISAVTGQAIHIDFSQDQKSGDVYFIGWYQGAVISYHDNWFAFDMQPVDKSALWIDVTRSTPEGYFNFLQFTVPAKADPHDLRLWSHVKSFDIRVQRCSGFSPAIPGCENLAPWAY